MKEENVKGLKIKFTSEGQSKSEKYITYKQLFDQFQIGHKYAVYFLSFI